MTELTDEQLLDLARNRGLLKQPTTEGPWRAQGKALLAVGKEAGKLALAAKAGDLLLDLARSLADELSFLDVMLESEDGREIVKVVTALLVQTTGFHTGLIPQRIRPSVLRAAELVLLTSGMRLVERRLGDVQKAIAKLASAGEALAELGSEPHLRARVDAFDEAVRNAEQAAEEVEARLDEAEDAPDLEAE